MFLIDIDIDRFKQINDAIGYTQGDELIRAFTKRMQACVPARALVGRIGAGEFAVLLADHQIQGTMESMAMTSYRRSTGSASRSVQKKPCATVLARLPLATSSASKSAS